MSSQKSPSSQTVRLDKWLWAARFFKTRALARQAIQAGQVSYNGTRSKPSKTVEVNATLTIPRGTDRMQVVVLALSEQRRGAPEAQLLYSETEESVQKREQNATARKANALYNPHPQGRPDKKQRRNLIKFKQQ